MSRVVLSLFEPLPNQRSILTSPSGLSPQTLSPRTWNFSLDWLPPQTYLVGGNVRDALLGRQADYLDLDFVMPSGAVETAKAIASHYNAGFVLLDADRQIARVVFAGATVDFAQQVGPTLESDLERRDFTVNAIAYSPFTEQLLDPLQGCSDLRQNLIRMIAPENLKEDPLRLLRAYRQAAQLGFALEVETQATIRHLAGLLATVAAERVQSELNYLLGSPEGTLLLQKAGRDGLLKDWLPQATAAALTRVAQVDQAAIDLIRAFPGFEAHLMGWLRDQQKNTGCSRNWLKIAKLACLVAALPTAEPELWRLKYSRAEVQAVLTTLKFLPQLQDLLRSSATRQQYFFFQNVGAAFPALAVLARATEVPITSDRSEPIAKLWELVDRFLTPNDPICHPLPLLTGRDLITALQMPPGPQIGQLLLEIQLAQAEGKISTPQAALEFAQSHLTGGSIADT